MKNSEGYMESYFGIMFHYFHDQSKNIKCQGSLSASDLVDIIEFSKKKFRLLDANEYVILAEKNKLEPDMACLTFDDGLLCQYEVAMPVLNHYGISAFWFIYTMPFMEDEKRDKLEIYHYFRNAYFDTITEFYNAFFDYLKKTKFFLEYNISGEIKSFKPERYRPDCEFYTYDDRLFRYIRSNILKMDYHVIMEQMMNSYGFNYKTADLWIKPEQLKNMAQSGQVIGLHTHTHNTDLCSLTYDEQKREWEENKKRLKNIIQCDLIAASYPCGNYNIHSIEILKRNKIKLAFSDRISKENKYGNLSIDRVDSTKFMNLMR